MPTTAVTHLSLLCPSASTVHTANSKFQHRYATSSDCLLVGTGGQGVYVIAMDYDDVFQYIGERGLYQNLLFLILSLSSLFSGPICITPKFAGYIQGHWCYVERLKDYPHEWQKYLAIPYVDGKGNKYDSCRMYDLDYANMSNDVIRTWNRSLISDDTPTRDCSAWVYDQLTFISTIVSDVRIVYLREFIFSIGQDLRPIDIHIYYHAIVSDVRIVYVTFYLHVVSAMVFPFGAWAQNQSSISLALSHLAT